MPSGFQAGPIFIYFYGVIIMVGAVAAAILAASEARRRGQDADLVWDGLIWVLIGGIIGARLWHIFTPPASMVAEGHNTVWYLTHPLDMFNVRKGGLGIPGAVIGGVVALYWFCSRRKISFLLWVDIASPVVPLGQAIGRWGNYFNQELFGKATSLPWGLYIDPAYRIPPNAEAAFYHPLFLYESIWNLLNMVLLLWLARHYADRLKPGDLFLTYLVGYPVGRFFLEFLRVDASYVGGLNINQLLMLVIALAAGGLLIWRHRRQQPTPQSA